MPRFRQPSFSAGEIAPSLHGRTDLALYGHALKTCRNMIALQHGAATNRPGFQFVTETKTAASKVRLIPFVFSGDGSQAYVLEFGPNYVRFIARVDGVSGYVLSGGNPVEVVTPYGVSDLARLKFAQSGDILTIVHSSHGPRELKRVSHTSWTLTAIDFVPTIGNPASLTLDAEPNTPDAATEETHRKKKWVWVVTTLSATEESSGLSTTASDRFVYPDLKRQRLTWPAVTDAKGYLMYRGPGDSDLRGYVGSVGPVVSPAFEDDGQAPDYDRQPPSLIIPFHKPDAPQDNDWPAVVTYFQQRIAYGRMVSRPQSMVMSRIGEFERFDLDRSALDDDAIEMTIASPRMDEIRNLVPLGTLVVLTAGGAWSMPGPLTPSSLLAKPQSSRGSSWLDVVVAGEVPLYVLSTENAIRELVFSRDADGYVGREITIAARHIFEGKKVVDWTYAAQPHSIVWAVRDDGVLLGLTYDREQEVLAWHRHDSTDGTVENVLAIPEGGEHGVYVVMKRTIGGFTKRSVERLNTRLVTDVRLGVFLDGALTFDGRNTAATTMLLDNQQGWDPGQGVDVTRSAGTFVAGDVGDDIVIDPDAATPIRLRLDSLISATKMRAIIQTPVPVAFQATPTTKWAFARDNFSGLDHLEGKTVAILADGASIGTAVVASGAITLPGDHRGVIVHAGLPYTSDVEMLDLAAPKVELKGRELKVIRAFVDVEASRGLWHGGTFDDLREWQQRKVADGYGAIPLATETIELRPSSTWSKGGGFVLRQVDPLPLTILSVTRDAEIGS